MSLKFNSFRSSRYVRSSFVEGRFFLAAEATDLQLEMIDQLRSNIKTQIGNVALDDSFKVEKLTETTLLIRSGEAWFNGLPFFMRSGKDQLVSGTVLSGGILPNNVSISDHPSGLGKVITFNNGGSTPSGIYRIVLSAEEEVITNTQDPFLKNANITENTGQKIRINYKINIVLESDQDSSPIPYTNDVIDQNLINELIVTANGGGSGELLSTTVVSGAEEIDGRDIEIVINNGTGASDNPIPNSSTDQARFSGGKLIDSNGSEYHIVDLFNDTVATNIRIRIDKEFGQLNPTITNGTTFRVQKNEVFKTNPSNGVPEGKIFYSTSTVGFDSTDGVVHQSSIVDLREKVISESEFQNIAQSKFGVVLTDGGAISFNTTNQELNWDAPFTLINPHGNSNTVPTNTVVIIEEGALVYELDLDTGGDIEVGNLSVTINSAGATTTFSGSPDLSSVRIGNIIVDSGGNIAQITKIDNVNDSIEVSPALVATGASTIYRDSFAPGTAPKNENSYVLAVRKADQIWTDSRILASPPTALGWPNEGVTSDAQLAAAIVSLSSGGIILVQSDFTITSNHIIPDSVALIGRKRNTTITVGTGGKLILGNESEIRDLRLDTTLTGDVNLVEMPGDHGRVFGCEFLVDSNELIDCIEITGNGNLVKYCLFDGVIGGDADGIVFEAGVENDEQQNKFI